MASKTANYNLDMPGYDEIADIDVINGNMDKIDVQMKNNADSAQQSKDIVSDEYSATNTYAVGDYCIHENVLYKCKTAITTGEAFDSSKWVQTTCGTEFRELNSNLTDLAYGENSGSANIFNGKIVGGLLVENGEVSGLPKERITSDFIPVEPDTLYTQIAPTSAKGGRYCEYDANKNLVYFDTNGLRDTFTTKPTTKYLRISFGSGYGTTFKNDIAIIKGNATEYVPYIMSNKQLGALNESIVDQKMLGWSVPKECPIQNYVDSDGVFHQRVGRLDLGSLKFTVQSQHNRIITENAIDSIKSTIATNLPNAYTDYCRTESSSKAWNNKETIGRCLVIESYSPTDITIYSPPSDLSKLKGHYLYYELATQITMTIDGNEAVTQIKNDLLPKKGNWGDASGSVIDAESLKTSLLSNISKYNNGDTVNYVNDSGQKGVFLISKTDDAYFTALFISGGFGYNAIFTYQSGTWTVKEL